MATTTQPAPRTNGHSTARSRRTPEATEADRAAARPRGSRRNNGRIAIGVLVVALSALGAAVVFSSATDRVSVIGLARDVTAGQAIDTSDLTEVSLSGGDGLATIAAADANQVVGRTAASDLSKGSLLSDAQLTDGPALPDGTVVAGAVLKAGQYPVGLEVGDAVQVVETTAPDASGIGEPVGRGEATVLDLADSSDGQGLVTVSLALARDDAAAISAAGAAGRVSLVVIPS